MKRFLVFAIFLVVCNMTVLAADFDSATGTFIDGARNRKIPYKVYFPKHLDNEYPVVIVSHGLGGSREGNEQLGKHLASHGFVAIHIQHAGSDETLLTGLRDRGAAQLVLARSLLQPANAVNRFLDASFVVAQLRQLNSGDKHLKGHLNLQALGMAGHSYGAVSTLVAAGERMGLQYQSFKIPTLKAGLMLSPSPPREGLNATRVYQDVSIPLFHMTGTEDENLVESRNVHPDDRVKPYRMLNIPKQYLLVLDEADHMTFSGRRIGTREEHPRDKQHLAAVLNGALAFFKAYLQNDKEAEAWLQNEYKKTLGANDVFEFK
ncbi:MAG TPA: hypothetical protein VET48_03380 [Steroidobacteraceae bacterium]|nr:hypothetical protein [Steroidobacteraceae bacterium]